eukprot:Pgem_evm1s16314
MEILQQEYVQDLEFGLEFGLKLEQPQESHHHLTSLNNTDLNKNTITYRSNSYCGANCDLIVDVFD